MENLDYFYIRNNNVKNVKFDLEYSFNTIKDSVLFKLVKNLFTGLKYIHYQQLSLNGNFDLNDILYEVYTVF